MSEAELYDEINGVDDEKGYSREAIQELLTRLKTETSGSIPPKFQFAIADRLKNIKLTPELTAEKKAEVEQSINARKEELEKLKQTLLLTVAHELKTPLTAIKAGTEMLELQDKDGPISSTRQRLFRGINRGVERLERLVDESLDYARMQDSNLELELQPTDIRDLYEETIALLMPATRAKRQTLELVLPEDVPTLFVDRRRYERILLNLVSNANKYTDVGGSISVALTLEPTCLITSVTDTGEGIAQDELDKVFNVYYRTSAADGRGAGKSSGLGLAIAKYLVELHGGKIWVDSVLNEGSTFYFSVPLGDDDETFGYR